MTILAALWNRDGRPAAPGCAAMLAAQRSRGSSSVILGSDGIALGRACGAAPEEAFATSPVAGADGALALAADARLDNRDDLMSLLGLRDRASESCSDVRLMMLCFEKWGADAVGAFVGDFALALWDRSSETLLLARDFAGQRPLFFWEGGRTVAAASLAKGLYALDCVPRAVDELRVVEALAGLPHEGRTTLFRQISRVHPGEALTFRGGGRSARPFWTPPTAEIQLASAAEYAEALNERLDAAVSARLRDADGAVAAHLSGGLDSSAVVASAAGRGDVRIQAFTSVPSGSLCVLPRGRFGDEGALAAETAAMYPTVEHHRVEIGTRLPIEALAAQLELFERTDLNLPNLVWSEQINAAASAAGLRILLVGTAGNATVSYGGPEILEHVLAQGHFRAFLAEYAAARRSGMGARALLSAPARRLLPRGFLRGLSRVRYREQHPAFAGALNAAAPGAADVIARFERRAARRFDSAAEVRLDMLRRVDPGTYNKGVLNRWDVDVRDPTADRRVVEFCLQVPLQHYFRAGTPRALIRTALKGRVPESVRLNRDRGLQSANWFSLLTAARGEMKLLLARIGTCEAARNVVDVANLRRMLESWPSPSEAFELIEYRYGLLRGLSAGEFMRVHAGRAGPVLPDIGLRETAA